MNNLKDKEIAEKEEISDFKVYYNPIAPGIINLYTIISYQKISNKINSEWYYINGSLVDDKNVIYKGTLSYPLEIYGDDSKLIFNSLLLNCKMEIINNIIIPYINNNLIIFHVSKINYDIMQFNLLEVDREMLSLVTEMYKNELEKIKSNTKIEKIKNYLGNLKNVKFESGKIIE
jgi:hypothetical protein